jgi:hypothetical protein
VNIKRSNGRLISAGTTGVILTATIAGALALGSGTAVADPSPACTSGGTVGTGGCRTIALVGSDTTDDVMQALAEDASTLAIGGVKQVASYKATGTSPIQTHPGAGCSIPRPNGSGAGRTALVNALNSSSATFGCIQGSRSSSQDLSSTANQLTYIPFGNENVDYAVSGASDVPLDLALSDLQAVYSCSDFANTGIRPMLPQAGSGSRKFWIGEMYFNHVAQDTPPASVTGVANCLENGTDEVGAPIQEHTGGQVNKRFEISFYSVAQWESQTLDVITNARGTTRLGTIGGISPFGSGFPINRDVYNVFPTALVNQSSPPAGSVAAAIQALFVGNTSPMCTSPIVLKYGLAHSATCGAINLVTA